MALSSLNFTYASPDANQHTDKKQFKANLLGKFKPKSSSNFSSPFLSVQAGSLIGNKISKAVGSEAKWSNLYLRLEEIGQVQSEESDEAFELAWKNGSNHFVILGQDLVLCCDNGSNDDPKPMQIFRYSVAPPVDGEMERQTFLKFEGATFIRYTKRIVYWLPTNSQKHLPEMSQLKPSTHHRIAPFERSNCELIGLVSFPDSSTNANVLFSRFN